MGLLRQMGDTKLPMVLGHCHSCTSFSLVFI